VWVPGFSDTLLLSLSAFDHGQKSTRSENSPLPLAERHFTRELGSFGDIFYPDRSSSVADFVQQVWNGQTVGQIDAVVFGWVLKDDGDYGEIDQIGEMDSLDALGQDDLDAQVHWAQGGMFAGGSLSVAFARDDDAVEPLRLG